ncbi:P-loop containing nucleoside triphosphate hydrolase protein [Plectosphaerella plurivora]|uniref:P-loop containing nucleoside triphosphate hydrolase protein n=1 Tax=Plectosphaerella plurivora TaxID=936078 RepID=A0A9P8VK24_9PEZI|nr:P-loop containing nucleoside triphosphate hydrolase protein [Plectosphaerella plurivora]
MAGGAVHRVIASYLTAPFPHQQETTGGASQRANTSTTPLAAPEPPTQPVDAPALTDATTAIEDGLTNLNIARPPFRRLPTMNFLDVENTTYLDHILSLVLPQDWERLKNHLRDRTLGLGLITAGAGFGKTELLALAALVMQARLGCIVGTAPSNIAVDNFAERIHSKTSQVARELNERRGNGELTHRRLVVGYKMQYEIEAFTAILANPAVADRVAWTPRTKWGVKPRWNMSLSVTYWLLRVVRSPLTQPLRDEDAEAMLTLRDTVDKSDELRLLRDLATRRIDFNEFLAQNTADLLSHIRQLAHDVVEAADFLCQACNDPTLSAYGAILCHLIMAGDPKQLPPTVLTKQERDKDGYFINRHAQDGEISTLEFFQNSGWPVFTMHVQLRMARGLFDIVAKMIYPDLPITYGDQCAINLPRFEAGVKLEQFIMDRFKNDPKHYPLTGSRSSEELVVIALDFVTDFVQSTGTEPQTIQILAPYAANVELINERKDSPAQKDIVVVVMGTNFEVGPGFTAEPRRLNVLLTRAISGLVIVGDLANTDQVPVGKGKGKIAVENLQGETVVIHATTLFGVQKMLEDSGRVATVFLRGARDPARPEEKPDGRGVCQRKGKTWL